MALRPARFPHLVLATCVAAVAALVTAAPAHAREGEQADPPNWGLDRIDQREGLDQRYRYPADAANVTVYVIDSGVDGTHPDFEGRVWRGRDFVDGDDYARDTNGHGTGLAGIVGGEAHGVAKGVTIVPVRVVDAEGGGNGLTVVAGIDWVANHARQPAVALLGIGGPAGEAVDSAARGLAEKMPVVVPAGGAGGEAGQFSPGRVPEVLTVAASDRADRPTETSNFGPAVDLYAPGAGIRVPGLGGGTFELTGTSAAAAHVAGVAAVYRSLHPEATPAQTVAALTGGAIEGILEGVPENTANRLLHSPPDSGE
ncbi:subtilase family protein [Prauserella shujinwangii]|uniref:Subtilase family protein n=1 Tax=Prauserella shujinwangii TaxID=1453103 RepID=A0A2T0LWD1_9PSEU|nr:S8 family peptidase [Prauserella shujinwangii]PRX48324.1 subtilase family protein [Prauserella shujinwangii]